MLFFFTFIKIKWKATKVFSNNYITQIKKFIFYDKYFFNSSLISKTWKYNNHLENSVEWKETSLIIIHFTAFLKLYDHEF